jgi:large subunit ribosomal protein L3
MMDDSESPTKNMEVSIPCTYVEIPETYVYGARFYSKNSHNYLTVSTEAHHKEISEKFGIKSKHSKTLESIGKNLGEYVNITALLVSDPKSTTVGQHHKVRFESSLGGASVEEKFKFVSELFGKRVHPSDMFKNGEYVDVSSVSVGKGWQGTIKRFGTARLPHKATQKVRHLGALGSFGMGRVIYSVPQAGQMGFNYRTDYNKRILKIGTAASEKVNPSSGFNHYGNIKGEYVMLAGSIPGPSKRLVRIRASVTDRNKSGIKEPKITYRSQV